MLFLKYMDKTNRIIKFMIAAAFALMVALVFFQVLTRFIFTKFGLDVSVPWTEELSRYLMIWAVFLGAAVGMRSDRMLQLDAFSSILPKTLGIIVKVIALSTTIVFFLILAKVGYDFAIVRGLHETSPVMGIPRIFVFLAMPIGSIVMILNALALLFESIKYKQDIRFLYTPESDVGVD